MRIAVFATGGTFDKEYNELNGSLYFKQTHTSLEVLMDCSISAAHSHFVQVLPPGIYVAMNGRYFAWNSVTKNRDIGAFEEKCPSTKPSVRRRCPRRA